MRAASLTLLIALGTILPALGQQQASVPYRIEFDSGRDVTMHDKDEKTGKEGLYITVRFTISVGGTPPRSPAPITRS